MTKLELVYLKTGELRMLNGNPRIEVDDKQHEKLMAAITAHGFQNPLQIWKGQQGWEILCGNHRFSAGVDVGMKSFPCIVYKGNKKMALARAVSDNKSSLWTDWDVPLLKDLIIELDDGQFDITATGFSKQELHGLFAGVGNGNEEEGGQEEGGQKEVECPKCGHEFQA